MLKLRRTILSLFFVFITTVFLTKDVTAENDLFDVYDLNAGGEQVGYLVEDLNEDGLNDILIFHTRKSGKVISRHFSIFYHTANGFSNKADQSFQIDPEAVIYDVADVDGKPGKDILFFKSAGLFYYEQEGGHYFETPRILLKTDSIYTLPDKSFLESIDFASDLNGDGIDEILVPQFKNCLIYSKYMNKDYMLNPDWHDPYHPFSLSDDADTKGYTLKSKLDVLMQNSIISSKEVTKYLVSSFVTPNIVIADYNRDQRGDIIIIQETYLQVFFQDEQGNYSNDNSITVELGFELTQAYTLAVGNVNRRLRNRLKDKTGIKCLQDINNDGLLDIVIEKLSLSAGALNPKKQFPVFFGRQVHADVSKGGSFNKIPDHMIINRGFQVHSWIIDLNSDGKSDIVTPVIEIGLFNLITMLITGSIDVTFFVYLMDDTGKYTKKPDDVFDFSVEFHRSGRKIPVVDFDGDYNGDGRMDLLRAEEDNLIIHYSPKNGIISDGPEVWFPVEIPENGINVKPQKLNADDKSDVVIIYPNKQDENTTRENNVRLLITK